MRSLRTNANGRLSRVQCRWMRLARQFSTFSDALSSGQSGLRLTQSLHPRFVAPIASKGSPSRESQPGRQPTALKHPEQNASRPANRPVGTQARAGTACGGTGWPGACWPLGTSPGEHPSQAWKLPSLCCMRERRASPPQPMQRTVFSQLQHPGGDRERP